MPRSIAIAATTVGLVAYLGLARLDLTSGTLRADSTVETIWWYLLAFAAFVVAIWQNERIPFDPRWIWGIAMLFRLVMFTTDPTLSDDVYRYLWDGHVTTQGVSPYSYSIDAPELDHISIPARDLANNPNLSSPYLPVGQAVFAGSALVLPSEPWTMQFVMLIFELMTAVVLSRLLRLTAIPRHRILLYLWNPLVIVEIAHGAHIDALMVMLTMAAILATLGHGPRSVWWLAPVALGAATLTRPIPLLLAPMLWLLWQRRQRAAYIAICVGALVPFGLLSGWGLERDPSGTGLFGSARVYSQTFEFNSTAYYFMRDIVVSFTGDPSAAARGLVIVITLAVLVIVTLRARNETDPLVVIRLLAVPTMAYVLLTPVLNPWYLVALAAFVPFLSPTNDESVRRWASTAPWLYLMAAVIFSYLAYRDPSAFGELDWVRRIEWLPTYALLGGSLAVSSNRWVPAPASTEFFDSRG